MQGSNKICEKELSIQREKFLNKISQLVLKGKLIFT